MSRVLGVFAVVLALGCESKGIDSESHFLCTWDSDCVGVEGGTCVAGRCRVTGRVVVTTDAKSGTSGSGGEIGKSGTGGAHGFLGLDGATSAGGKGDASSPDGATSNGGTPSHDAAASSGGKGGASSPDGATSSGGTGGVVDASGGGQATDAGIDASTDAPLVAACNATSATMLATAGSSVDQIVLDGGYVYFHDGGGISRVPRTGGSAVRVASFHSNSYPPEHAFAVDDSGLTWWELGSGADGSVVTNVNHAAKTGGPVTTLASLPAVGSLNYSSIARGPAGSVFLWSVPNGATPIPLRQVRTDGSVHLWGNLYTYYNRSNDVVFDGTDVFATGDNGPYVHVSNSVFDGFTAVTNANAAQDIVIEGATMYIGSSDTSGYVSVFSAPKTGGQASLLYNVSAPGVYLGNLTMDASNLYVVERMTPAIVRMGKDGSNPTEIVKGLQFEQFEHVAVDDTCIYWSRQGSIQGPNRTPSGVFAAPK